jgi:hypothetical protein
MTGTPAQAPTEKDDAGKAAKDRLNDRYRREFLANKAKETAEKQPCEKE